MKQNKLIYFRESLEKTQEEMAKTWGISISHYKKIEYGLKNPSLEKIKLFKVKFPTANTDEIFLT